MKLRLFEDFENAPSIMNIPGIDKNSKGKYLIPGADFEKFPELEGKSYLNYASLMRYLVFQFFAQYTGDDRWTKWVINVLENPEHDDFERITRNLNQLGTNKNALHDLNQKYNLGIKNNHDNNLESLSKLYDMENKIFNHMSVWNIMKKLDNLTKIGNKSEKGVIDFLQMVWKKFYKVYKDDENKQQDIDGVDLMRTHLESGKKEFIQVKNIKPKMNIEISEQHDRIRLPYSGIDLHNYINRKAFDNLTIGVVKKEFKGTTADKEGVIDVKSISDKLGYDYLVLWDATRKKLYYVHGRAIKSIKVFPNKFQDTVVIYLFWSKSYNPIRIYKVPDRFLK